MKPRNTSELDIASNIRQIEMLKCDLLCGVSQLYQLMQEGSCGTDALGEAIAGIMFEALQLSDTLGVPLEALDKKVTRMLRAKARQRHQDVYYAAQ
jgi:hypothetical protein